MARRLLAAGHRVRGSDRSAAARAAFVESGGEAFETAQEAAQATGMLITMLPSGQAVREVLLGADGAASALAPGALVVDMSSSAPADTRSLAGLLAERALRLVDAPVSGGVARAADGTLTVMAGGTPADIERALPYLAAMANLIRPTGAIGSGHAVKALNNYVSAAGLVAACEAVLVAERLGVDPALLVDILNASTGRNNSTERKLKPFILSRSFASGFSLDLMAKDVRTAAEMVEAAGLKGSRPADTAALWRSAAAALGTAADHTEIYRYLAGDPGSP